MTYFKIYNDDFSMFVNQLTINKDFIYNSQTNAAGDTVVDLINSKRTIDVGIIPLSGDEMALLQSYIDGFQATISFMNPVTGEIEENVKCIIPSNGVEYYTIRVDKVMTKAMKLKFIEL
jgi:hypothetical protein